MYVFQIPQSIYGVMVCVWLQPRHDLIQVYLKPLFKPIHLEVYWLWTVKTNAHDWKHTKKAPEAEYETEKAEQLTY